MNSNPNNGRSLAAIIAEMKEELKEFVQTRSRMLKAEVQEKFTALKIAAPLAGVGALLLGTAYLLFTMALVALVSALFRDNPYRWCFAFAAIAVLWGLLGGIAAYLAKAGVPVERPSAKENFRTAQGRQALVTSGGEKSNMNTTSVENLELRALEQRNRLHKTAERAENEDHGGASENAAVKKRPRTFNRRFGCCVTRRFLLGYGLAGMFTDR